MGRRVLRRHIWGYSVCLCPIKGTPGLNELNQAASAVHIHTIALTCTSMYRMRASHIFDKLNVYQFKTTNLKLNGYNLHVIWIIRVYAHASNRETSLAFDVCVCVCVCVCLKFRRILLSCFGVKLRLQHLLERTIELEYCVGLNLIIFI